MTDAATLCRTATNPSDFYAQLLAVKEGKRGFVGISKKHAKACGFAWDFVEASCAMLGLKLAPHGRYGYCASRHA